MTLFFFYHHLCLFPAVVVPFYFIVYVDINFSSYVLLCNDGFPNQLESLWILSEKPVQVVVDQPQRLLPLPTVHCSHAL